MFRSLVLVASTLATMAAPGAIDSSTGALCDPASCPLPCAADRAQAGEACDLPCDMPCDMPCAEGVNEAVAAK